MKLKVMFIITFLSFNLSAMDEFSIAQTVSSIKQSQYMTVINHSLKKLDADDSSNGISIVLVIEDQAIWTKESIIASHIERVKKSLDTCQLKLKNILTINVLINNQSFDNLVAQRSGTKPVVEVDLYPKETRFDYPTLFLLKKRLTYKAAKAFTDKSIKRSERFRMDWGNLKNTMWITGDSESYLSAPNTTPSYSVLAHEISHIIGELGHVMTKTPNLMSSSDIKGSHNHQLNSEQCNSIRLEQGF